MFGRSIETRRIESKEVPRPKSYDRDEAIVRARDAFWQHGYRALGVRELGSLAGINRFALSTDFGGKENLFLEAIDAYFVEANQYFIEPIRKGDVRDLLDAVAALAQGDERSPRVFGCLMVNTMIESAGQHDGEIAKKVERHFQSIRRAVKANVVTSRKR
ncbi:MAG: TetR/AcrR family transcriptional regulator, partial [Myxococcota bacterium]